jgi:hypothetical protein
MNELERFLLAMTAPGGITIMGAVLGIKPMFIAGLVFCGIGVLAGLAHYRMNRW